MIRCLFCILEVKLPLFSFSELKKELSVLENHIISLHNIPYLVRTGSTETNLSQLRAFTSKNAHWLVLNISVTLCLLVF